MAGDDKDELVKLPFSLNFGLLIAFFLPGSVAVYALTYPISQVAIFFLEMGKGEHLAGVITLLGVMSLVVGLIVDSIREILLDGILYKFFVERNSPDVSKYSDTTKYNVFSGVIENYFRYYQFSGNTLIALFFLVTV